MLTYLIVIILLLYFRHLHLSTNNTNSKRWYIILSAGILIFLAAFRYILPGTDIEGYYGKYLDMPSAPLADIWEYNNIGMGYYTIQKLFSLTNLPYYCWFAFVQLLVLSALLRICNRYTSDSILCLLLYFTTGLFSFTITGLRQALAMGLVWHGLMYIIERKNIKSTLLGASLAVIAFYCHSTVLIMLFAIPIYYLRGVKSFYKIFFITLILFIVCYRYTLTLFATQLNDEHYMAYLEEGSQSTLSIFLFMLLLFIVPIYYLIANKELLSKDINFVIGLASLAAFSQLFALFIGSAFRLGFYYNPFLFILIIYSLRNNKNMMNIIIFLCSFWLLYTSRTFPYQFMW
ncbi:EpsG family protein [Bacteroides sp.]